MREQEGVYKFGQKHVRMRIEDNDKLKVQMDNGSGTGSFIDVHKFVEAFKEQESSNISETEPQYEEININLFAEQR